MEKNVPTNTNHSRRHSTGNFYLEPTGYEDVLSRYLSGPFPSCHDHCKPSGFDHPTKPNSTGSVKRSNKHHVDSVHGIKKHFTPIPKSPTEHVKTTNTSLSKHHAKPQPIEFKAKRQDFKSKSKSTIKSKSEENDPFYIPPSGITRRFSDIIIPTNDFGGVLDAPAVGGLTRSRSVKKNDSKIESRKDLKPVKSRTVKTPENGKISKTVQTLITQNSSTKPEVDHSSKKSKPVNRIGKEVEEKEEKTQIPNSRASSKNEERLLENGQNGAQISSKSKRDENQRSESQSNVKKAEKPTRVGKFTKENEDCSSQKLRFKQGKITDKQCESSGPRKLKFGQGKVLDVNQNGKEDSKSLRRLSCDGVLHSTESNSVNVVLKPCDMEENKRHLQGNKVIEETASKLIQTRKSKVQALVGAFEMISTRGF